MSECEGNNSGSIVTTEVGVGMSTRQLQDLLTNALSTLRTDIVTIIETNNSKFQAECSNLKSDFLTITEQSAMMGCSFCDVNDIITNGRAEKAFTKLLLGMFTTYLLSLALVLFCVSKK
jgi:hypothetical protein